MSQDVKPSQEALTRREESFPPLLPLPEPDHVGGNDVFGKEFPLFTTEQAESYARANMEPLIAENERLRAEVARQESLKEKYIFQSDGWEYKARASEVRAERLVEALRSLLGSVDDLTSYAAEDDEIGHRPCCNVLSYKEHTDDCAITQARAALDQEGGNG